MKSSRHLLSWIALLLACAIALPAMSGCEQLGLGDKKSSKDEDDDDKKKKDDDDDKKKKDDDDDKKKDDDDDKKSDDDDKKSDDDDKKSDDDDDKKAEDDGDGIDDAPVDVAPPPASDPLAGAVYKSIRATKLQVPVPAGWKEFGGANNLYTGAQSADGKAAIAFTTISSRGELAGRLQDIENKLGIENQSITKQTDANIGRDKIMAHIVDATCTFHGKPGVLSYVVVDAGTGRRLVLVIYAAENDTPKATEEQGHAAVLNIRRG